MSEVLGHCFCGAIHYSVSGPERYACICYCESCQRAAGAPAVAWATYAKSTFSVRAGELRFHSSSPGVSRGYCADCGSSISYENAKRAADIDITVNTLADPDGPVLRAHIWTEDKRPWTVVPDDLPVYTRNSS